MCSLSVVVYLVMELHGMSHKGFPPKRKPKQVMDPGATTKNSRHDRSGKDSGHETLTRELGAILFSIKCVVA